METLLLLVGFFAASTSARLATLAGRAGIRLFDRVERSPIAMLLTAVGSIALVGLLLVGFWVLPWWVWLLTVVEIGFLTSVDVQANNSVSGFIAMPALDLVAFGCFLILVLT